MTKFHYLIIIFFVLFSILLIYFYIPNANNFFPGPDEQLYFNFASIIMKKGISQFPIMVKAYADSKNAHLYPAPSRAGYILLAAFWFKLFGPSPVALAKFSFFCYFLYVVVCFWFSRKFFGKDISYLFTLLVSSSPLIMAMAKRALTDSTVNLFWALSVWTFMDFLRAKGEKGKFLVFLIIYSFCITVKESSFLLMIFFVTFFLVHKYCFKNAISNNHLLGIIFIPLIIVGIFYLILCGGVINMVGLIKGLFDTLFGKPSNYVNYGVLFYGGPWYRYIIDFLLLSPITTLLFIGYFGYVLVKREWEWKKIYFLVYFIVLFAVFSSFQNLKIVRLVINLDMALCLSSVLMLNELFRQKDDKTRHRLVFISVVTIFLVNYINFDYLFYQFNIYDPATYFLLVAKKLLPYR